MDKQGTENELLLKPDDIAAIVDRGVAETVRYVAQRSPFYREAFRRDGVRAEMIRSVGDLEMIAPTCKEDLAAHTEEFHCVSREETADIVTTSGTTGRPVIYPLTRGDVARLAQNERLSFTCAGITPGDTVLVAVTLDKCFMAGMAYYEGIKLLGATAVRVGSGSPAMLVDMVKRLGATAIVSVPSFLARVAEYARDRGIDTASLGVKRLVCIGEPVRGASFELNNLGGRIADAWSAKVYSTYGATEVAGSLCECEAGCGGHLHPALLHVEILDDDGRRVEPGGIGEVVATTIGVDALPLVRFRTGDVSFLVSERCPCGRYTPRIGPILGRKNEMLKFKGTTVFPTSVYNVLDSISNVMDYVLVATASTELSDELEVVAAVSNDSADAMAEIAERLKGALKVTPRIRFASSDQLAAARGSDGYRKKRLFVDRRAHSK